MSPRSSIDERLSRLREIRNGTDLDKLCEAVPIYLADRSNLIVAEAARLVTDFELTGCESALTHAWKRLIETDDPVKADKGCTAKAAIIGALAKVGYDEPEFYLAAISYRQIEPAWPRAEDTAENVRAGAALALARSQRMRTVDKLVTFVDYQQGTPFDQIHAARAMSDTGSEWAIPLLRMKLLSADVNAEVAGACMSGLLELAPTASIPLVNRFLRSSRENVVLEAAAALGICGKPAAVKCLIDAWKKTADDEIQRSLLLSIGLSRDPSAVDFLIGQLETHHDPELILEALKPSLVYEETRLRVDEVRQRSCGP